MNSSLLILQQIQLRFSRGRPKVVTKGKAGSVRFFGRSEINEIEGNLKKTMIVKGGCQWNFMMCLSSLCDEPQEL